MAKVYSPKKTRGYRLLEILPGALTWVSYIVLFTFSFVRPVWVIYFIILYALLWLMRVAYFVVYLFIAWGRYKRENAVEWIEKIKEQPDWDCLYHAVFLPNYKEPMSVLRTTLEAIKNSSYPLDKVIIIFGVEARAGAEGEERAKQVLEEYSGTFYKVLTSIHPDNIPGELKGKSANMCYMADVFKRWVDEESGIPYENIIVESFDCDTAVDRQYLARVSYAYLTHPRPTRASYQPLALYNNNLWESPSFTRVVANSTTFWLMTELARPEQFMTFSSHSMSFKALVDVGYWDRTIVTEDSRIFLQCFFHYEGEYDLVPMYIPINMDSVAVKSIWGTIKNQYMQMRRWAWSVEHQPWMFTQLKKHPKISSWTKFRLLWKFVEGQLSWATAPMFLTIFSRLPLWVASSQGHSFVLIQNAPLVLDVILGIAMIGMIFSAIFNIMLLPGPPPKNSVLKYLVIVLQWFLLPITLIVFGSVPAIDAQTRLMFGKYLGFWNTEKDRL